MNLAWDHLNGLKKDRMEVKFYAKTSVLAIFNAN